MSTFRRSQNRANPNKLNNILSTLIFILILNVSIQIWLLYASLNNALENNKEILLPAFIASAILFFIGFAWMYYLPKGNFRKNNK
jgi:Sec-independent protein secretion pathway component TatC